MPIVQSVRSFLLLFLLAALAVVASAQKKEFTDLRYMTPDKFERATKTDDKGLIQWAEHKAEKCATCKGTTKTKCVTCERFHDDATFCIECKRNKEREAVCRVCAGLGTWPDPLEKVHCPECRAAGFALCGLCMGGGKIKPKGGGDRWQDCSMCRGEGGFKCGVCNGARLVEVALLKPSLKDANAATLTKAIGTADQMLTALGTFTSTGKNTRKEVKELTRIFTLGQAVFPPMKRSPKALEDLIGKVYGASQFEGFEDREANALNQFKSNAEYYLKHQKRMMELAQKRAEANEKLLAENKGK